MRERRAAAVLCALAALLAPALAGAQDGAPVVQRQQDLLHLLLHDCGSCHGMRMTGGLGPPLTPEALRGKPDAMLAATVLLGRPGTPMPPWQGQISEAEADWLVQRLREGIAP